MQHDMTNATKHWDAVQWKCCILFDGSAGEREELFVFGNSTWKSTEVKADHIFRAGSVIHLYTHFMFLKLLSASVSQTL